MSDPSHFEVFGKQLLERRQFKSIAMLGQLDFKQEIRFSDPE